MKTFAPVLKAAAIALLISLSTVPGVAQTNPATATPAARLVPAAIRSAGVLRVGGAAEVPPYLFVDDTGQITGVESEFMHALGDELGLKIEITNTHFAGLVPGLLSGRIDVAMSDFSDTAVREQQVDFLDYTRSGEVFLVQAGNPKHITTLDSICGLTAAAPEGTVSAADAQKQSAKCTQSGKPALTVMTYPSAGEAQLQVQNRRADVLITDYAIGTYQAKKSNGLLEVAGEPFDPNFHGCAVKKDQIALRNAIEAAFSQMMRDGKYRAILAKWNLQRLAIDKPIVNAVAAGTKG